MGACDRQVEAILEAIGSGADAERETARLRALGASAVPRLIRYVCSRDERLLGLALYALQFCWTKAAIAPVAKLLADPELDTRRMAAIVIDRHEGREEVARRARKFISHPDLRIARFAYEHHEFMFPSVRSVSGALDREGVRNRACKYLARYHSPALAKKTRALLEDEDVDIARAAIIGLINQNDTRARSRERLRRLLMEGRPDCRDAAAEYFAWHGEERDEPALASASEREQDPYARASMVDAIECIGRRRTRASPPPKRRGAEDDPVARRYRLALEALGEDGGRERAFSLYRTAEPFEPRWFYQGAEPNDEFVAARHARYEVQARLFGFPWRPSHKASDFDGPPPAPLATRLMAPVAHFFEREEDNFGLHTESTNRTFKSVVHVGDDIGWYRDHDTVVAIADGVVRRVIREHSWGHLLIIEHRAPRALLGLGRTELRGFARAREEPIEGVDGGVVFCSLYAHLGPFIRVRAGDWVRCGQKVASTGRTLTFENGGYPSHLHFGLHLGPYLQRPVTGAPVDVSFEGRRYRGKAVSASRDETRATIRYRGDPAYPVTKLNRWECGYIARWYWKSKKHGWLQPLRILTRPEPV